MFRIFTALIIFASALSAQAQDAAPADSAGGGLSLTHSVFGGLNFSKFKAKGVDDDKVEYGIGAEAGYSLLVPMGDSLALRTGAGIVQKAAVQDTETLSGDLTLRLTYVEIPATVFVPIGNGVVNIIGGVAVNFLVNDDCDVEFGSCSTSSSSFKKVVTTGIVGGRFRLGGTSSRHNLEALFDFGLSDLTKYDTKLSLGHSVRYVYNF